MRYDICPKLIKTSTILWRLVHKSVACECVTSFVEDPLPEHVVDSQTGRDIDNLDNFHICSKILPRLKN